MKIISERGSHFLPPSYPLGRRSSETEMTSLRKGNAESRDQRRRRTRGEEEKAESLEILESRRLCKLKPEEKEGSCRGTFARNLCA